MKYTPFLILLFLLTSCKTRRLAIVKSNGKYGCINTKGKFVVPPIWDWMLLGHKTKTILVKKDSLHGFVDRNGNILINPQYVDAYTFHEGFATAGNGKKMGLINLKGDTVVPFIYDDIFLGFSNGLADVEKNDSCGYINRFGKIVIPLIYKQCYPFMSSFAQVTTFEDETFLINKKGKIFEYDRKKFKKQKIWPPVEVYPGSFTTSTGQGRLNSKGDTIVPPIYQVTGNLSEHRYIVKLRGKWGVLSDKGAIIVEPKFDMIWHFEEGYANFKLNGKWGYINMKGETIIEPKFDYGGSFNHGYAYVELNGKSGFINKKGKFIINPIFEINPWHNNFE